MPSYGNYKITFIDIDVIQYLELYDKFLIKLSLFVKYKCPKMELEDIKQQIILHLLQNCKNYDEEQNASITTYYSQICINAANSMIKKYWQYKNRVYAESVSLDNYLCENEEKASFVSLVAESENSYMNPKMYVRSKELMCLINDLKETLSEDEKKVFNWYLDGYSIEQIALKLNKSKKTIYNTVSKIRCLLKDSLEK